MSSIGSVGSSTQAFNAYAAQRVRETNEIQRPGGSDGDGDADDRSKASASAPKPTVNLQGQTVGQKLDVAA
jgi:hypothetical protein